MLVCSQIFELFHPFKGFITFLYVEILSCLLVTRHDFSQYLLLDHLSRIGCIILILYSCDEYTHLQSTCPYFIWSILITTQTVHIKTAHSPLFKFAVIQGPHLTFQMNILQLLLCFYSPYVKKVLEMVSFRSYTRTSHVTHTCCSLNIEVLLVKL